MTASRVPLAIFSVIVGWLYCGLASHAADLTGNWITDIGACTKVFVKTDGKVSIAKDADLYGSGFIIEQNRIRGKIASCDIIARKQEGDITNMVAKCSTDIALDTIQFSIKMNDKDKMTRIYPGIPELSVQYFRCP
jgi:hypothetical protein